MLSPSFALLEGFTGICLKISQSNPVVEAPRRAVPSPIVSPAPAGGAWIFFFFNYFFSLISEQTFLFGFWSREGSTAGS